MQPSLPPLMAFADSSLKDTLVGLNFLRPTERKRLALLSAPLTQAFSDGGVLGALPPLSQTTLKGGGSSQREETRVGVCSVNPLHEVSWAPLSPPVRQPQSGGTGSPLLPWGTWWEGKGALEVAQRSFPTQEGIRVLPPLQEGHNELGPRRPVRGGRKGAGWRQIQGVLLFSACTCPLTPTAPGI